MTDFFTQKEFDDVKKQRLSTLISIIVTVVAYVAVIATMLIGFANLPYGDDSGAKYQIITYAVTAFVIVFTYVFIGIRYKRVNKYYNMLSGLFNGASSETVGKFVKYSDDLETKDGIDVKHIVLSVYSERRSGWFERFIYVPYEKDFPKMEEGDMVRILAQSNMLVSYEIIEK